MRLPEDEPACDPAYDREERECPDCGGTGGEEVFTGAELGCFVASGGRLRGCGYCGGTGVIEVLT